MKDEYKRRVPPGKSYLVTPLGTREDDDTLSATATVGPVANFIRSLSLPKNDEERLTEALMKLAARTDDEFIVFKALMDDPTQTKVPSAFDQSIPVVQFRSLLELLRSQRQSKREIERSERSAWRTVKVTIGLAVLAQVVTIGLAFAGLFHTAAQCPH
jgi:hypothetical protein